MFLKLLNNEYYLKRGDQIVKKYKLDFDYYQKKKGLTDSELARRINKSRSSFSLLRGRRSIDFETLTNLCGALEVEPKDIIVKYEVKH